MIILGLFAIAIFLWALFGKIYQNYSGENIDVNTGDNTRDNTEDNTGDNIKFRAPDCVKSPTDEMDPLDAPSILLVTSDIKKSEEDFEIVEPESDDSIGVPKHLRTDSYEDKKSTLATIFDNVKPKTD
jgi:hypothetical protein